MQWSRELAALVSSVRSSLCISSPYVTDHGVEFLLSHLASVVRDSVQLTPLTDLSPMNVAQGATSPPAIYEFGNSTFVAANFALSAAAESLRSWVSAEVVTSSGAVLRGVR
jgi:hypothetical protein